jgi:putative hydrolase of the HAD superfamily
MCYQVASGAVNEGWILESLRPTMPIKVLMVDVDGVIVHHPNPKGWSANLEQDLGLSRELLQRAFFTPHFGDIVHGRAELHERLAPVLSEIAPHISSERLVAYWFEHDAHLNYGLLRELADVRSRGIKLHLATVQEHKRAAYLWETLGLRDRFDAMHYAADIGWAKPAPEFFAEVETRTGFGGADIFFIDDSARNVDAAKACGWRAAVWTGAQSLASLMDQAGAI